MTRYVSTKGGIAPVAFDEALLQGFAADGGLFVPETIPVISRQQLENWSDLTFQELAFELLSLFIDRSLLPATDLQRLLDRSFNGFERAEIVPLVPLPAANNLFILELFHGPTLSFKDMAMGFLMNTLDYFLEQRNHTLSIILATTGDTGPAAAYAAAGKKNIDCWPLYPRGMISEEQERQMTTLQAANIHPVGVEDCADGGDDLDLVVARLFSNEEVKTKLHLSSVNSINWGRVMVQAVHYFYGYYRAVDKVGEKVVFSVPSGAFGNLFGGFLARSMGLPVEQFICANNRNNALHIAFSKGVFEKKDLVQTPSSAIDIVVPYNFWRFLYFCTGGDGEKIRSWMEEFSKQGRITLDNPTAAAIKTGFCSASISDEKTAKVMRDIFRTTEGYLLDPHSAVAVAAAQELKESFPSDCKIICLATAHPAKFPQIVKQVLQTGDTLPAQAVHSSIVSASRKCQHLRLCDCKHLETALVDAMSAVINHKHEFN